MHNRMEKAVIEPFDAHANPFSKYAQPAANTSNHRTHSDHDSTTTINTHTRRASSTSLTDLEATNTKMIESAAKSSRSVSGSSLPKRPSGAFPAEVSPTADASSTTSDLEAFLEELSRKEAEICNPSVDIICMVDSLKTSYSSNQAILKELDEIAKIGQEGLVLLQRGKKHVENARLRLKSTFLVKGSPSSNNNPRLG